MKREEPHGSTSAGPGGPLFFKAMDALAADRHVLAAARLAAERGIKVYLVGGVLRNLFLGRPLPSDYDFVVEAGKDAAADLARAAAGVLGGAAFVLDRENGLVRVAVKGGRVLDGDASRGTGAPGPRGKEPGSAPMPAAAVTLDFLPLYCRTLEDDLLRRDFTVNAMAVDLGGILEYALRPREGAGADAGPGGRMGASGKSGKSGRAGNGGEGGEGSEGGNGGAAGKAGKAGAAGNGAGGPARGAYLPELIDPSGGVRDCGLGVIRMVSRRALADDPLRCLRAVRLSMEYGLEIEPGTREEIRRHAHLMTERGVAAERIRDELAIIFGRPGTAAALCALASLGLMKEVMPAAAARLSSSAQPSERGGAPGPALAPLPTLSALDDVDGLIEEMAGQGPSPWVDEIKAWLRSWGPQAPLLSLKMAAFFLDLAGALVCEEAGEAAGEAGKKEEGKKEEVDAARGLAGDVLRGLAFGKKTVRAVRGLISLLGLYEGAPSRALASSLFKPLFFGLVRRETGLEPPLFFVFAAARERAAQRSPSGGAPSPPETAAAMLREYFERYAARPAPPIFSGEEIMSALGTGEGREVGEVMKALEKAVLSGRVRTMDEARAYIKKVRPKGLG